MNRAILFSRYLSSLAAPDDNLISLNTSYKDHLIPKYTYTSMIQHIWWFLHLREDQRPLRLHIVGAIRVRTEHTISSETSFLDHLHQFPGLEEP